MSQPKPDVSASAGGEAPRVDELHIRPMRVGDIPAVRAIEVLSYTLPWSEDAFRREITQFPHSHLIVAEAPLEDGEGPILGYAGWWEVVDECHITNVSVSPAFRRQGIGRFIMEGLLADARRRGALRATLEVRVGNEAAVALYEQFGFMSVAIRRKYYPDNGEDAFVMWKEIAPPPGPGE